MASRRLDMMMEQTSDGSVNLYDNGKSSGTAVEKGLASRMGGHTWNIITGDDKREVYFSHTRNPEHPFFLGDRRTKVDPDPRGLMKKLLTAPAPHRRETAIQQRRKEVQLAQVENATSYRGFQDRCGQMFPQNPQKRYSIENHRHVYETEKLKPRGSPKQQWLQRRGETMSHSISCPSVNLRDPAGSLDAAMRADPRKQVSQLQTESDRCIPRFSQSCLGMSLDATSDGRQLAARQGRLSVHRVEPAEISVTRKNNHYSGEDPTTKHDPYFQRPAVGVTNNSVKYDIVTNQRRWFKY